MSQPSQQLFTWRCTGNLSFSRITKTNRPIPLPKSKLPRRLQLRINRKIFRET